MQHTPRQFLLMKPLRLTTCVMPCRAPTLLACRAAPFAHAQVARFPESISVLLFERTLIKETYMARVRCCTFLYSSDVGAEGRAVPPTPHLVHLVCLS